MAVYKCEPVTLNAPADKVYDKLSNLENLKGLLARVPSSNIPEDKRAMFDNIEITPDSITVPGGPVGTLTFKVVEKIEPVLIKLAGEGSPIPLTLAMHIERAIDSKSQAWVEIDINLPPMLKPMVSGPLQKMADQFGQVLQAIPIE